MARRRLRMALGIVGGVVAVMVLVAVLLPLLVPREKLRSMAETQLREVTGGEVSLGDLSLKVFPRLRLVLGASTVAVTRDGLREAGLVPGPLLAADLELARFEVDLALLPLLSKQLEFGQVVLVGPHLNLVTEPLAAADDSPAGATGPSAGGAPAADPGVGLALAAVTVRDGELIWREDGTDRQVAVRGWQQDLEAPGLGLLLNRLQRLGGMDLPADHGTQDAVLEMDTRVAAVDFAGFGENMPPLVDLRLQARLAVPSAADRAEFQISELSLPGWNLTARGQYTAEQLRVEELVLAGGDAVHMAGSVTLVPPPATGPLRCDLTGSVDLARILAQVESYLPPRPDDAPPLPELAGKLNLALRADLRSTPDFADADASRAAWQEGLDGVVELRVDGGPVTVSSAQLGAPLQLATVKLEGDLSSASGMMRVQVGGFVYPGVRGDATAAFVMPPATGPLQVELTGSADLANLMAQVEPLMPPREPDAPPLPDLSGSLNLTLTADLATAPSLADTTAWQLAWQEGLDGVVELRVDGGPVTVVGEQLGAPLKLTTVKLTADLNSAAGTTRVQVGGVDYPGIRGDATAAFVLPPATGPLQAKLTGSVDLAELMAQVEPLMPPREPGAAPLPDLAGSLNLELTANLATAPSLADTAAWSTAWQRGLDGSVALAVSGGPLKVTSPQLGPPLRIGAVSVSSDLRSPSGETHLEFTDVNHPGLKGKVVAEIVPAGDDGAVQARLELPLLDLDALAALAKQAQATTGQTRAGFSLVAAAWAAEAARPLVGELIPPDLAADLEATVRELRFLKTPYTDVRLTGSLRERVIDVPRLSARLGTGRVSGVARLDYAADPGGRATWDVKVTRAPASALMRPYLADIADIWTGNLSAEARGACDLADPEAIRNSLTLEGDLHGSDGVIDLRQRLGGVSQYLGNRQDLLRVIYSAADQHFKVRDGKVFVEGLRIDGKDTDWTGGGLFSLEGRMDVDLSVRLPAGYTPDLGDLSFVAEALRDDEGRIGLDFGLTGPTKAPAVKLKVDPAELMKSDAVQDKLEEEVKKGLGGLLDRLKGK